MRAYVILPLLLIAAAPAAAQVDSACSTPRVPGHEQSPVDLSPAVPAELQRLEVRYPEVQGHAFNTGSNIKVKVEPGNSIILFGQPFELEEFHFHWPGEHVLGRDTFPVEIHMVHKRADGRAVALGTWVRTGAHNHAWDSLWARLPTGNDTVTIAVNIPRLFSLGDPNAERIYRYCGSLTTGQHEEGITWLMRGTPIEMSRDQIKALRRVMGRYSRRVQPLGRRVIRYQRGTR